MTLNSLSQDVRQQAAGYSQSELEMGARGAKDIAARHRLTLSDEEALILSRQVANVRNAKLAQTPAGRNNDDQTWQADVTDVAIKQLKDPNYAKPFQPTDLGVFAARVAAHESPPTLTNAYPPQTSIIRTTNLRGTLDAGATLPTGYDWRQVHGGNFVTTVKDQASCGSCWAFSGTAVLESAVAVYRNQPGLGLDLSEQDALSCNLTKIDNQTLTNGCSGGFPYNYFDHTLNPGAVTESCQPYRSCDPTTSTCSCPANRCATGTVADNTYRSHYQPIAIAWQNADQYIVDAYGTANNIKRAIIEHGPVTAFIIVYSDLNYYTGGVYAKTAAATYVGVHAITVVGWGHDNGTNLDYWIIKNSWGNAWGEGGYFRYLMKGSVPGSTVDAYSAYLQTNGRYASTDQGIEGMGGLYVAAEIPAMVYSENLTIPAAQSGSTCSDRDQDTYCFWGLGTAKPANGCPASCASHTVPDCDDGKNTTGPNCQAITAIATPTPSPIPTATRAPSPTPTRTPTPTNPAVSPTAPANSPTPTRLPTATPTRLPSGAPSPTHTNISPTQGNPSPTGIGNKLGDINGDNTVNQTDIDALLAVYGQAAAAQPKADLNGDGRINAIDYARIIDLLGT